MMRHFLARLAWLPVVLWAVASLTFFVLRLAPGDPLDQLANQIVNQQEMQRVRAEWGLDRPVWEQYTTFLSNLARGDLGYSLGSGTRVTELIWQRMPATIELALLAFLISTVCGIGVGIVSAVKRGSWIDPLARFLAVLGLSMPWFWVALMLIVVFSVQLGWTPVGGRIQAGMQYQEITGFMVVDAILTGNWPALGSFLRHLALPALALGLTSMGFVVRVTRSAMLDVLGRDYIRTARAKGLEGKTVVLRHALRNALLPVITVLGLQFGSLLGGAVITESVFAWPGLGRMLLDGILRRDYPVVQGTVIFIAFAYVMTNLAVEMLYPALDPRLRG